MGPNLAASIGVSVAIAVATTACGKSERDPSTATGGAESGGGGGAQTGGVAGGSGGVAGSGSGGAAGGGSGGAGAGAMGGASAGAGGGCSATELQCAGACVDAATDANNCGACGSVCASGAVCVKGTCACPDTQTLCGGACADTNADASNCGDCGQTCLSGGLCLAGKCACPDAQMECGGACVDAERDVANCGSCGNACATNLTCIEGTCGPWAEQVALSETGDACARFKDDTVRCWKIGVAPTAPFSLPGVVQVEKGHDSSCALLSDGTVRCWGWNFYGQLGDGTNVDRLAPVAVKGLEGVQQISTGEYHSCARLSDGTIRCWGSNLSGEIGGGGGTWKMHATPVPVPGVSQVAAVAAGTRHTCVGLNDGGVRCWGTSYKGGLGVGPTDGIVVKPTTVPFLPGVIQVAAGLNSTCALLGTGSVKCWGQGYFGSLGNHSSPKSIVGLSNVAQIATSGAHHCALDKDGSLRCWGKNHGGQVGDGTTTERLAPTLVSAIAEVKQVALQPMGNTCACRADGAVFCWGYSASEPAPIPTRVKF